MSQTAYRKYRVRVRLTADQIKLIDSCRVAQRHVYNWVVSRIKSDADNITEYGLYNELTVLRGQQEWMRAVPSLIQRAGIQDAFKAYKMSARYGRGHLRFRTLKHHSDTAVRCAAPAPRVIDGNTIRLPCFGDVRVQHAMPNEIMENDPRSYEFARTRIGRYVLYVSCRVTMPAAPLYMRANQTVKGIDRGAVEPTVVATLDGSGGLRSADAYDTAAPFRDGRAAYQRMQLKMSKMNKHSGRFRRLHAKLRLRLQKTRRQREYAEYVAAKQICTDHGPAVIVLEDLNLRRMTCSGRGRRHINREMRFVRHHIIEQRIRDRAEMAGIRVMSVNPRYTSQTCSRCGHVDKDSRVTRDMLKCTKCSYVQQADANAALVIGGHGLPQAPDDADMQIQWQAAGAGTALVRRELDARLNCFTEAVGGVNGRRDNQAPAHHLAKGMEKERRKVSKGGGPRRRQLT